MGGLSIPINIRRASMPSSSDQSEVSGVGSQVSGTSTNPDTRHPTPDTDPCPYCKGAGWLRMHVPVSDPRFGKLYPCICRTQATEERNLEDLNHLSNLDA